MRGWLLVGVLAGLACGGDGLEGPAQPLGPGEPPSAPVEAAPDPVAPKPAESIPPAPSAPAPRVPAVAPQFEPTQCSRTEYRQDGSLLQWALIGADGIVREHHAFEAEGNEGPSYLQWVEGGRVVAREDFSRGAFQQRREWHYGERGELLRIDGEGSGAGTHSSVLYAYDPQGRLAHEDSVWAGELQWTKSYLYTDGRLVRVETHDADVQSVLRGLTTYTHHPNGQVKHSESWWDSYMGLSWGAREDFDEEGRLLASEKWFDSDFSRTEQSYDARGRLAQRVTSARGRHFQELREETLEYDEADRLVLRRLAVAYSPHEWYPMTSRSETWRSTYGALGELVLLTVDLDADGVPEGRRHFTYDAVGRLTEEWPEGTVPPAESGRVVYTHGCQG